MEEAAKRRWDVGLGIIGPFITVAGLLVGVWQFNVGEARKATYEHNSKIWLLRVDAYTNVAKIAGRIATSSDAGVLKPAYDEFMAAYWGEMILVEEREVERAMMDFRREVEDLQKGESDTNRIRFRADVLVKALKASIARREPQQ